jgi:two-component system chemotaxis response regulator CheY
MVVRVSAGQTERAQHLSRTMNQIATAIRELVKKCGKKKAEFTPPAINQALYDQIAAASRAELTDAMNTEKYEKIESYSRIDACKKKMPDVVLLDWNMPVMSGIDFLRQLLRTPCGEEPVVVFCTTENDLLHIQEAIGAGADDNIMKPFDSDLLPA